ncbi:MAG: lipopolysaccharide biosynthesis protein [Gammaproteobacteria bacterium]
MKHASNKIVSHTSIYMYGTILRHSVSVIMLPIYTRYLTPEDYGIVELLSMLIDFATIIFGARVAEAVFRYYCTAKNEEDKKSVITSALFLGFLLNGVGSAVLAVASEPLAIAIFSDPSFKGYITLFAINMFLFPLSEIPLTYIRAEQKPWTFLFFSILKLALQLSLNLYFVVFLSLHVEGVIYSAVISSGVMAVLLIGYTIPKVGITIRLSACKRLFSFSLPLKFASIGTFYLTFGDRYILNIFDDLSQVGIYSLGYKFGFIFTLLAWTPFEKMWDSEMYLIKEKPDCKSIYQRTFLYISLFLIFLGLCISLYTKDLLKIMADPAFLDAYKIVPIIIVAYVFQAWTKFCSLGILLQNKTIQIAYSEMIAALIVTVAYFTLIPAFGIFGAAWATVIGFIARFYWTNKKGKKYFDMELPWKKVIQTATLALITLSISFFIPENILTSILFRTLLIILFVAVFMMSPILSRTEKVEFFRKIYKSRRIHQG